MKNRKQLTLFLPDTAAAIEKIRAEFNPEQFKLIPAHVTLCREEELEPLEPVIDRLRSISLEGPVRIRFKKSERSADGKGVVMPATDEEDYRRLRSLVLGASGATNVQSPHITLMHPRNSSCSEELFRKILHRDLPAEFWFDRISLIEQKNSGKWKVLEEFGIVYRI